MWTRKISHKNKISISKQNHFSWECWNAFCETPPDNNNAFDWTSKTLFTKNGEMVFGLDFHQNNTKTRTQWLIFFLFRWPSHKFSSLLQTADMLDLMANTSYVVRARYKAQNFSPNLCSPNVWSDFSYSNVTKTEPIKPGKTEVAMLWFEHPTGKVLCISAIRNS